MTETGSAVVFDGDILPGVELRIVDGEIQVRGDMLLRCYRDGTDPRTNDGWFPTNDAGEIGWQVWVGGGLGRTPMVGMVVRDFLPIEDLLPYVEAVLSVYNILGRRDNKYKARIKITVHETGAAEMTRLIEARFVGLLNAPAVPQAEVALVIDLAQRETERLPPERKITLCGITCALAYSHKASHLPASLMCYLAHGRRA